MIKIVFAIDFASAIPSSVSAVSPVAYPSINVSAKRSTLMLNAPEGPVCKGVKYPVCASEIACTDSMGLSASTR